MNYFAYSLPQRFSCCTRNNVLSAGYGGGWGYSGHSIEAIRFMADTDVLLAGFGLFGGRGEYTGKIRVSIVTRLFELFRSYYSVLNLYSNFKLKDDLV